MDFSRGFTRRSVDIDTVVRWDLQTPALGVEVYFSRAQGTVRIDLGPLALGVTVWRS